MKNIGGLGEKLKGISCRMSIEALCGDGVQQMIESALEGSNRMGKRYRALHPIFTLWIILALPLYRFQAIPNVVATLLSGLRGRFPDLPLRPVTDSAIAHARHRIGIAPVIHLCRELARRIDPRTTFHGLRVWALDGTSADMPDTPDNVKVFGKVSGSRGDSAFPKMRIVALMDMVSRRIKAFRVFPWNISETRAVPTLAKGIGQGDVLLADRGLYSFAVLLQILSQGGHFLFRVSTIVKIKKKKTLGNGDWIGVIDHFIPLDQIPSLPGLQVLSRGRKRAKVPLRVRVIEFTVLEKGEKNRLVTSLLDSEEISAKELALLYHERWGIELGYDEMKTHLSSTPKGAAATILRSKSPRLAMQEVYALIITYNLVRGLILEAAERHDLPPAEIGFVDALTTIHLAIPRFAGARTERLPWLYKQLLGDLADCRILRPRRHRRYPRVVKIKMSTFLRKRPEHVEQKIDYENALTLGVAA